jgi:hypothetical protein
MFKVQIKEENSHKEKVVHLVSTFSSIIDDKWSKEFDLASFNNRPCKELFKSLETMIANMHISPTNYEPDSGDESGTVVDAVQSWLGEIYMVAYNHPEATIFVTQS